MTTYTRRPEPGRTSRFYVAIAFAVGLPDVAAEQAAVEQFDIIGSCIPAANEMSVERFREMAGCGLTAGLMTQGYDEAARRTALTMAAEAGIKLFVFDPEVTNNPEAVVAKHRDHPAVAGYFVADEPTFGPGGWSSGTWKGEVNLGDIVARLKKADPARQPYINLFR
jgi:hypothetical protein